MQEIEKLSIPTPDELSVKKLWEHFKSNKTVMEYMPDYASGKLLERDSFPNAPSTLHPKEVQLLAEAPHKASKLHFKKMEDEIIELTPEIKKLIESTATYKSKFFHSHRLLTTAGRVLWMLKKKSPGIRKLKERITFPANLARFVEKPNLKVIRLSGQSNLDHFIRRQTRDEIMESIEEEKKKEE